jgi:DNA-binding CsgD family transcriptional regulator
MTASVCGSQNSEGKRCRRVSGHGGTHYDSSYSSTWTDDVPLVEFEEIPSSVHFARIDGTWLSERELQVLQTAADGLSTDAAGERLGLRRNTVKTHKARIARKLGALNTAHAVAKGFRAGVLQ